MKTTAYLTFVGDQCGKAEEALNFYMSIFPNPEIKLLTKCSEGENGGPPELIKYGLFTLNVKEYIVSERNYNQILTISGTNNDYTSFSIVSNQNSRNPIRAEQKK